MVYRSMAANAVRLAGSEGIDPADLPRIAAGADRVVAEGRTAEMAGSTSAVAGLQGYVVKP